MALPDYDFKSLGGVSEEVRLILVSSQANSNKFWNGYLCGNGTIVVHNGRVGDSGQIRPVSASGQSGLQKLEREKIKKGYTKQMIITGETKVINAPASDLARKVRKDMLKSSNPLLDEIVDLLVKANVHQIVGSTSISYNEDSGLFSTPLGIITQEAVADARLLLDAIHTGMLKGNIDPKIADDYLRIVPQSVGRKLNVDHIFGSKDLITRQLDNLDSLEASIKAVQTKKVDPAAADKEEEEESIFKVNLDVEDDDKEIKWIHAFYEKTRNVRSTGNGMKIGNIFRLELVEGRKAFEEKGRKIGNLQKLWHGTSTANVLSILQSGLRKAPPTTARIAGKAFGNGVYFSDIATKSLGYAMGYWGGYGTRDRAFMLLNEVAMGKSYDPSRTDSCGHWPKDNTDSTFARGGGVFQNNEMIVYQDYQVNTTHLVEFLSK